MLLLYSLFPIIIGPCYRHTFKRILMYLQLRRRLYQNKKKVASNIDNNFDLESSNNIILTTAEETIKFLKKNNIKIFSSFLKASRKYQEINYNDACAIVLGSEDKGISKKWIDGSDELIYIPMQGHIDSLNVSNSGAIIIYEAKRQRNFK